MNEIYCIGMSREAVPDVEKYIEAPDYSKTVFKPETKARRIAEHIEKAKTFAHEGILTGQITRCVVARNDSDIVTEYDNVAAAVKYFASLPTDKNIILCGEHLHSKFKQLAVQSVCIGQKPPMWFTHQGRNCHIEIFDPTTVFGSSIKLLATRFNIALPEERTARSEAFVIRDICSKVL